MGVRGPRGPVGPVGPIGPVVHDERRERGRDRKALYRAATLLAFPVAILALIPSAIGFVRVERAVDRAEQNAAAVEASRRERVNQINRINQAQCASLQNLYAVIRKALQTGDAAIDRIQYYQQHPTERAAAHQRNREIIRQFKTPPCPANVNLSPP